ncbi:hypothetical protein TNCT_529651 [Trichonephila clavata]|uniref:Uncharacterized protein n=1 Tax=Trichonephila clavata TaxID=2740835 RepID=A0A8X6HAF9_TRICU|nr:hypothetical protein TNCT_529651 [Trichonephila clavata]
MDVIYFPEDGVQRDYKEIVKYLDGIVLMIDITEDEAGLLDVTSLLAKLMKSSGKKRPPYILVGNKKDVCIAEDRSLEGGYKVKNYYEDGDNIVNKIGAKRYFECSAKRNLYCLPLALYVLQNFIQKPDLRT